MTSKERGGSPESPFEGCTDCFEFQNGNQPRIWCEDSIYLEDDGRADGLIRALVQAIDFDPYDVRTITKQEWEKVKAAIPQDDELSHHIYEEANQWLLEVFKKHPSFTIVGQ